MITALIITGVVIGACVFAAMASAPHCEPAELHEANEAEREAEVFPGERMALNADEFATRWAVTPEYIRALRKAGKLPYLRDGHSIAFPVVACDRAMVRAALAAKTDAAYQRNRARWRKAWGSHR